MNDAGPVRVRDAGPADLDRIVAFNRALAVESEGITPDEATLREGAGSLLADPSKGRYYIAEIGGRPVGQCLTTYEWSDWRCGMYLWLQSVYVEPRHRRRGVFRTLYSHVREIASGPGHCGIRLYVHRENRAAREVYRRMGMVPGGYEVLETPDPLKEGRDGPGR